MGYDVSPKGAEDVLTDLKKSNKALVLLVSDADDQKNTHKGFAAKIIGYLAMLLSQEEGRQLVIGLANGEQSVTIQPEGATKYVSSEACRPANHKLAKEHQPTDAIVVIDPGMNDNTLIAFDDAYEEILQPAFVTLGHELIHALHFTTGTAANDDTQISHPDYHDYEEEQTIASGPITENMVRAEHGFPARFGHNGKDQRFPHLIDYPGLIQLSKLAELTGISAQDMLDANHDIFSDPYNVEVRRMLRRTREQVKTLVSQHEAYSVKVASLADEVLWDRFSQEDFKAVDGARGRDILLAFFAHWKDNDWTNLPMFDGLQAFPELMDSVDNDVLGNFVATHNNGPLGTVIHGDAAFCRLMLDTRAFAEALNEQEDVRDPVVELLKTDAAFTVNYILRTMDMDDLLEALAIPPETIIRAANPADILCQQLVVPGWYTHYVSKTQLVPDALFKAVEQRYNVSPARVKAANEHVKWDQLSPGTRILIPQR